MNTKKIVILIVGVVSNVIIMAQTTDFSGFTRTYEGVTIETGGFSIIQQTMSLNFEKREQKTAFLTNPMVYLYDTDSLRLALREVYMDMYFKKFDIRLGKQQVVWGKADGVFVTDIVSPLDLSEFLLPEFDEIRQGVIASKINYYLENSTIEVIWIPIFSPNVRPDINSAWYVAPDFPIEPSFDWSNSVVHPSIENSELFMKWSAMTSKIDFECMGGYTWDDNPALHVNKTIVFDTVSGKPIPVVSDISITPEYHRLTVVGGSLSSEIKGVIIRGESAYYDGKYFQTENPLAIDALVQKNFLNYVVGLDFSIKKIKFSTQFIQKYILDYEEGISENEFHNTATFLARFDMLRETLHLELFSYIGLSESDALIRPKVTYDFDDGFSLLFGANIFVGEENGQFGKYQENSMIYTKIKYSF